MIKAYDFFYEIDTEVQAYFRGYFFPEKSITENSRTGTVVFNFPKEDKPLYDFLRENLEESVPFKNGLKVKNRMLSINIRTFPKISAQVFHHFVRGLFDKLGSIDLKKKEVIFSKNHFQEGPFKSEFFKEIFYDNSENPCIIKDLIFKLTGIDPTKKCKEDKLLQLKDFLYKDATIYLKRNRDKFDLLDCFPINKILCGDCLEIFPGIPKNSVDLVITSPPYNLDVKYDVYKDKRPYGEYLQWLKKVFENVYNILKTGGRCAIIIGDHGNGRIALHSDICWFMTHELKYLSMATIIWKKNNASNRQSWGSFASPKALSFPSPFEYIMVFAKRSRELQNKLETDLTNEEFVDWSLAMWDLHKTEYSASSVLINNEIHPAPFPEEIPKRLIKMLSWKGSIIMDPFVGRGTTAIVAAKLFRYYIGIDLSPQYCSVAEKSLKNLIVFPSLFEGV